jgi:hypothetical protein
MSELLNHNTPEYDDEPEFFAVSSMATEAPAPPQLDPVEQGSTSLDTQWEAIADEIAALDPSAPEVGEADPRVVEEQEPSTTESTDLVDEGMAAFEAAGNPERASQMTIEVQKFITEHPDLWRDTGQFVKVRALFAYLYTLHPSNFVDRKAVTKVLTKWQGSEASKDEVTRLCTYFPKLAFHNRNEDYVTKDKTVLPYLGTLEKWDDGAYSFLETAHAFVDAWDETLRLMREGKARRAVPSHLKHLRDEDLV